MNFSGICFSTILVGVLVCLCVLERFTMLPQQQLFYYCINTTAITAAVAVAIMITTFSTVLYCINYFIYTSTVVTDHFFFFYLYQRCFYIQYCTTKLPPDILQSLLLLYCHTQISAIVCHLSCGP